ncbi:holo-ACP synthase [Candidatus Pelagibacter sp.]|nr:holo-ACP synthase [Candidatus Pelagibacter sp.]|tara:strand:+ start:234 stop:623 length:390 start_codon:yes stop_codon:yes gene_type:complete
MHIIGNGVDIIKNSRINNSLKIKGFLNRIFTEKEIQQGKKLKNKINFYAKRFAAKEAFVKAIGTGFRSDINFIDIEIKNYKNGKPYISLSKKLNNFLQKKFKIQKYKVFLSLSDEKDYSIAFVVIDKKI